MHRDVNRVLMKGITWYSTVDAFSTWHPVLFDSVFMITINNKNEKKNPTETSQKMSKKCQMFVYSGHALSCT